VGLINRTHKAEFFKKQFATIMLLLLGSLSLGQEFATNILMLLLFLLTLFLAKKQDWLRTLSSPIFILPSLFYLFSWLSLFWTESMDQAFPMLETKASFLLAPLLLGLSAHFYKANFRVKALRAFVIGNLVAAMIALAYAAFRSFNEGHLYQIATDGISKQYLFLYTHLAEPIMHPGYFASFLGLGLFISLYLSNKEKGRKYLYLSIASFLFLMMLLLQTRINLLAVLFIFPVGVVYWAFKQKAYKLLAFAFAPVLALALLLVIAGESFRDRYLQLPDFSYDISGDDFNSATYRLAEWECAAELINENLWTGTGVGDNREELIETYRRKQFWQGVEKRYNAHNQYLESFISTGLIGLFLLLLALLYYLYTFWKRKDYINLVGLLFLLICLLTESMFERVWGVLLFTIYFPLMMYLGESPSEENRITES
jgi:O-antigen ligase